MMMSLEQRTTMMKAVTSYMYDYHYYPLLVCAADAAVACIH
jgi:hypothetical protein